MMNVRLIETAIKLVNDYYDAQKIQEQNAVIIERAVNWYNYTEIVDAEMLAAVVIHGPYNPHTTWDEVLQIKEFYFPTLPIELTHFHIGEIEEALIF